MGAISNKNSKEVATIELFDSKWERQTTIKPKSVLFAAPSTSSEEEEPTETDPDLTVPLTPNGQGTLIDDATDEDGKEFYTITTPDENVFYLVIDKQRENQNVYFLNAVTESDLMALAEKDKPATEEPEEQKPTCICGKKCVAGEVDTACQVCILNLNNCIGIESKPIEETDVPKQPKTNKGALWAILPVMLIAGGVGYYLKIYKPKRDLDDAEDFDELTNVEEEMVNEDEEPDGREATSHELEATGYSDRYRTEPDEPDTWDDNEPNEPDEPDDDYVE